MRVRPAELAGPSRSPLTLPSRVAGGVYVRARLGSLRAILYSYTAVRPYCMYMRLHQFDTALYHYNTVTTPTVLQYAL